MNIKIQNIKAQFFLYFLVLLLATLGFACKSGEFPALGYAVEVSITGLSGTLVLQNNLADDFTFTSDGSFTFTTPISDGNAYSVTVLTQPSGQTCTVSAGSGHIDGANITVSVVCISDGPVTYTVGGSVTGLSGTLILQDNLADDLTLSSDGNFTFATSVSDGSAYSVTVLTQPSGQTCTVSAGSGTLSAANVTDVSVTCVAATYTIGGTLSGLISGTTVNIVDDGGIHITLSSNGPFTFSNTYVQGATYNTGEQRVSATNETCTVSNASGTISNANVTNITITCTPILALFGEQGNVAGSDLLSRANVDSLCQTTANNQGLNCTTDIRAFISMAANDEIRDMPDNYNVPTDLEIRSVFGDTIQSDWASLLSGTILEDLDDAQVIGEWWSGSTPEGAISNTCGLLWTDSSAMGEIGVGSSTGSTWITSVNAQTCGSTRPILCLCY